MKNILEDIDFYITHHRQESADRPKKITNEVLNSVIDLLVG